MKIFSMMCIIFSLVCWGNVYAQQKKEIKGTVVDGGGEGLIGVSVSVTGASVGTVTDLDGNFTLSVPANAKNIRSQVYRDENTNSAHNRLKNHHYNGR